MSQFLSPAFRRFCALEVAAGRLNVDLAALDDPKFIWPAWAQIDPLAETQADALALEAGLTSRVELISKRGRDAREVLDEIAADKAASAPAQPTLKVVAP